MCWYNCVLNFYGGHLTLNYTILLLLEFYINVKQYIVNYAASFVQLYLIDKNNNLI